MGMAESLRGVAGIAVGRTGEIVPSWSRAVIPESAHGNLSDCAVWFPGIATDRWLLRS